jgi:malonyl-CoA O-methyltransferase
MTETFELDKAQIRLAFERAVATYDRAAVLQREVANRMAERLELVKMEPKVVVDAGCGTGYSLAALRSRYPKAHLIGLDMALGMLRRAGTRRHRSLFGHLSALFGHSSSASSLLCADVERLPLKGSCISLLWSNLTLQWMNNLNVSFRECHRVLAPGGLLMFSIFGPDTLKELRASFARLDNFSHVNRFVDMHDIGDMLLHNGFSAPVMDMEYLTLTYEDLSALLKELKSIGAHNVTAGRRPGLMGKGEWEALQREYGAYRRDGRLPASFEVIYGHAWVGEKTGLADGRQVIRFKIEQRKAGLR